jgi:hypothetical protein
LNQWLKTLPQPWTAAMEATIFTGWIYDHLKPQFTAWTESLPAADDRLGIEPSA